RRIFYLLVVDRERRVRVATGERRVREERVRRLTRLVLDRKRRIHVAGCREGIDERELLSLEVRDAVDAAVDADEDLRLVRGRELAGVVLAERTEDRRAIALADQERHLQGSEEADVDTARAHGFDLSRVARHRGDLPREAGRLLERRLDGGSVRGDRGRLLRGREREGDRSVERTDARTGAGRCLWSC